MKKYFITFMNVLFISVLSQRVQYATRFRNFSVESETNSIYMINMTISQYNMEHRLSTYVNITQDIRSTAIHVVIHRCRFEKSACENFQTWKFINTNLNGIVYMKNQLWSPLFSQVTPRLDYSSPKKNIYSTQNATIHAQTAVSFYPEIVKYYWKADCMLIDREGKKAVVLKFDFAIFEYVERDRKRKP